MREEKLVETVNSKGEYLMGRLRDSLSQHPHLGEVRGKGLLASVELVKDRETLEHFPIESSITNKIIVKGLEKGVFFYGGGTGEVRDLVCFGPAFTISESQIDRVVETFVECVNEVTSDID